MDTYFTYDVAVRVFLWIACIFGTVRYAKHKRYNSGFWGILSVFLFFIPLLILLFLKPKSTFDREIEAFKDKRA